MLTVLFVIHYPVFGGPHNQALRLARPLAERGWRTVVALPDEPGNAVQRLRDGGVEVVTLPLHRLRATSNLRTHAALIAGALPEIRGLQRLIREREVDVVQIGGLVNPHAAIAARLEHVPVAWQLLDTRAPSVVAQASMVFVREFADVVMSTGRSVALAHPGGARLEDRLVPFFPPVDVDLFRPGSTDRDRVRAEWGISDGSPVVGCVANVNPQKGTVELVRAFARVRDRVPNARLVLVGREYATHTEYSSQVRGAIAAAGLVEGVDVVFAGEHADVERQLQGFDLFGFAPVLRGEGVSTCVLEAMAAGLPVVTTAVAGLPEVIDDGVDGRLVPPCDPSALAQAIVDLLTHPAEAARMGLAARSRAVERFGTGRCADDHIRAYAFALARRGSRRACRGVQPVPLSGILVCPDCRGPLDNRVDAWACVRCAKRYPVVDGIPVLISDLKHSEHDEIDHLRDRKGTAHKAAQAEHFDLAVAEDFEIERPHGTPRLYRFLLREKFRRATAPIGPRLVGATALTVCGGSGMDAEYLACAGARVVASDLSLGAARRTRERARRHGLEIAPIVADVEHLPFRDRAFDLVLVHDGLHHLERPVVGLDEMARVAGRWVSATEPARAALTKAAVRAGLALEREEAGNRVARLSPGEVVDILRRAGFRPLVAERYAMYYRHEPGPVCRALSVRPVFPAVRLAWRLGNRLVGRFGNKLTVVAEREPTGLPARAPET